MPNNNKFLVVGLGNIGIKYIGTRHNVGFDVVDMLAKKMKADFRLQNKCNASIASYNYGNKKVFLAMPQTFMNLSGDAVKPLLNYYDIPLTNLIVVYDDIYLDVGRIRIRERGSAGGHNGMKHIIARVSSEEFIRVRVGVSKKPENVPLANYVLSKFAKEECEKIDDAVMKTIDAIEDILDYGCLYAMNKFNGK